MWFYLLLFSLFNIRQDPDKLLWKLFLPFVDQCFHTAIMALASLITTWDLLWRRERAEETGGVERGRESERGSKRGEGAREWVRERAREECISSSQDFIWLFGQIGRIQNAAGACDVAIKRLPLIPPHNFFSPLHMCTSKSIRSTLKRRGSCASAQTFASP